MQVKELEGGYLLRLETGDELIGSLATLMRERGIGCGAIEGLGAVSKARLGCFRMSSQDYIDRSFEGDLEIVGLTGTLSWYDGEPFPHVHIMLTDDEFQAVGGHCFEAVASATIEVFVRAFDERVERQIDELVGLHLMELP